MYASKQRPGWMYDAAGSVFAIHPVFVPNKLSERSNHKLLKLGDSIERNDCSTL